MSLYIPIDLLYILYIFLFLFYLLFINMNKDSVSISWYDPTRYNSPVWFNYTLFHNDAISLHHDHEKINDHVITVKSFLQQALADANYKSFEQHRKDVRHLLENNRQKFYHQLVADINHLWTWKRKSFFTHKLWSALVHYWVVIHPDPTILTDRSMEQQQIFCERFDRMQKIFQIDYQMRWLHDFYLYGYFRDECDAIEKEWDTFSLSPYGYDADFFAKYDDLYAEYSPYFVQETKDFINSPTFPRWLRI